MRFTGKVWAAITIMVVVAMVSQVALAQNEQGRRGRGNRGGGPGGFGGRGPVSMAQLTTIDKVQEVLKLSDEQKEKIKKINDESREEMRKEFQSGGRPDPEKMQKMREDTTNKVKEVLDSEQQKRLIGILIQLQGAGAVNDPAVAKELNITDDQKSKLAAAREENMKATREAFEGARDQSGSREDMRAKMDKLREEANSKVKAVLTSEQQEKLESLKGEKVEIDMSALRGGGGGGGDRPRGDRPNRGRDRGNDQPSEKKAAA